MIKVLLEKKLKTLQFFFINFYNIVDNKKAKQRKKRKDEEKKKKKIIQELRTSVPSRAAQVLPRTHPGSYKVGQAHPGMHAGCPCVHLGERKGSPASTKGQAHPGMHAGCPSACTPKHMSWRSPCA